MYIHRYCIVLYRTVQLKLFTVLFIMKLFQILNVFSLFKPGLLSRIYFKFQLNIEFRTKNSKFKKIIVNKIIKIRIPYWSCRALHLEIWRNQKNWTVAWDFWSMVFQWIDGPYRPLMTSFRSFKFNREFAEIFSKTIWEPISLFKICERNQIFASTNRKKECKSPKGNQNIPVVDQYRKTGTEQLIPWKLLKTQV